MPRPASGRIADVPVRPLNEPRIERGFFVRAGGSRTHVLQYGSNGPPVLLLHGLGSLAQEILAPFRIHGHGFQYYAPDRPGYGMSEPPHGASGPAGQARWLRDIIGEIGLSRPVIVAHSLACGTALSFAAQYPEHVGGLLLIAPFCRPTPHAPMPGLRLATMPLVGHLVRHGILPAIASSIGQRKLVQAFAPHAVPCWLRDFPFFHAAQPHVPQTMSAELLAFNEDMETCRIQAAWISTPTHIICARDDRVSNLHWHVGWLVDWCTRSTVQLSAGGHLLHHVSPVASVTGLRSLVYTEMQAAA